jgi:hypothetical protein
MPRHSWAFAALALLVLAAPAAVPARTVLPATHAAARSFQPPALRRTHAIGLGAVLTTKNGGQVFGFDIDQNGNDGALAAGAGGPEIETFDQDTGKIGKSTGRETQTRSYAFDGIFTGDTGLVTRFVEPKGSLRATRHYFVMSPVTGGKFSHEWTPPIKDLSVLEAAENQTTSTSLLYAIELNNNDVPDLIVSNVAANTFRKVIHLDPNLYSLGNSPQLGQYTAANEAIFATSPDFGAVGGVPPVNTIINLSTGKIRTFSGFNNGEFHAGDTNGMAVDPNTGVEVTDTELNAQVEFYDLNKEAGIVAAQLPCTGNTSQLNSGSGIAVDPVNKLFLVTVQQYGCASGSAIIVYDEAGNVVETITGFNFAIGEPAPAINPSKRMGWTFGPKFSQLQQFFY